jgi:hypothetical protein
MAFALPFYSLFLKNRYLSELPQIKLSGCYELWLFVMKRGVMLF